MVRLMSTPTEAPERQLEEADLSSAVLAARLARIEAALIAIQRSSDGLQVDRIVERLDRAAELGPFGLDQETMRSLFHLLGRLVVLAIVVVGALTGMSLVGLPQLP